MSLTRRCAMLLVVFAAGCSVWRPLPGGALAHPVSESLHQARVVLHDGTELQLEDAMITRDSIIGFGGEGRARLAVARGDAASVEARQPDGTRTFVAGGVTALSILALLFAAAIAALSTEGT